MGVGLGMELKRASFTFRLKRRKRVRRRRGDRRRAETQVAVRAAAGVDDASDDDDAALSETRHWITARVRAAGGCHGCAR